MNNTVNTRFTVGLTPVPAGVISHFRHILENPGRTKVSQHLFQECEKPRYFTLWEYPENKLEP